MTTRNIRARWTDESAVEIWAEPAYRRLCHRPYWRFWWRTSAKALAVSMLFWALIAWVYVKFVVR